MLFRAGLFIFFVGLISVLYVQVARKYNIVDVPNSRSSHSHATVRGIGIVLILILPCLYALGISNNFLLLIGLSLMGVVGFVDDLKSLDPILRLILYFGSVLLCLLSFDIFTDNTLLFIIILFITLASINAFNFIDGINGITLIYAIVTLTSIYILDLNNLAGLYSHQGLIYILITLLILSFFNVRKNAIAFLGDSGSIVIGAVVTIGVLYLVVMTQQIGYLILLLIYGVESAGTIIYRIYRGENILKPHRLHIYQKLVNEKKFPHVIIAVLYGALQFILNLSILVFDKNITLLLFIWLLILIVLYILIRAMYLKDLTIKTNS